jgi:hypothetical protein
MYETKIRNFAELRGVLAGTPVLSHESRGERFYTFPLETRRLSGAPDRLNIVARESLLKTAELTEAPRIHVIGELRSSTTSTVKAPSWSFPFSPGKSISTTATT